MPIPTPIGSQQTAKSIMKKEVRLFVLILAIGTVLLIFGLVTTDWSEPDGVPQTSPSRPE
jgi:hypothetical protein